MKKFFTMIAAFLLAFMLLFCFTACETEVSVTVGDDGYLIINGEKTDMKIDTSDNDGDDETPPEKTEYEKFKEAHPDYEGSEEQWREDMTNGKLVDKHEYDLVLSGTVSKGSVNFTATSANFSQAVADLHKPVILPMSASSEWKIEICGTILPNGNGGGQILSSISTESNGRIYLGVNKDNNRMFWGVCIDGFYANYCFDVPAATMSEEHTYLFAFDGTEFTLSIDGGAQLHLNKLSINNGAANTAESTGLKLSKELRNKMHAVTGSDYAVIRHLGSASHTLTANLKYIKAQTSQTYSYKETTAHPLADKTVFYLGSSITEGINDNKGKSFVEKIAALTGNKYRKEAVSGTTLSTVDGDRSYVKRYENFDFSENPAALVVQLSTNDFQRDNVPIGSVSAGMNGFDTVSLTGAIEKILYETKRKSPDTKVIFYSCPLEENFVCYKQYGEYIKNVIPKLKEKWSNFVLLDYYNAEFTKIAGYLYGDGFHPQPMGYAQLVVPQMINLMLEIL